VEVAARVLCPFIGSGRRGGGRAGSDGGSGALSRWWSVTEGEAKRRQHGLTSGPVRRRWPEAHADARRGRPSDSARVSEAGGRR
jgi:hypothetical protein